MDDYKLTPRASKILAAVAGVLAAIVALITVISEPPEPAPAPTPTPSITAPAALPPATGIDGEGIAPGVAPAQAQPDGLPVDPEQLPDGVQPVPDAGLPVKTADPSTATPRGPPGVAVEIPSEQIGVGGERFVSSPAFARKQRLAAGKLYPSGSAHWAWDVGIWTGTKVYAAKDGLIVGAQDGVKNHPAGAQYAVSGSPSNWLLLCSTVNGKPAVLYYQHLSPGLKVKRGEKVIKGKYVAKSGNTGNSTGPHLHLSSSYSPWACKNITRARAEYLRYDYLRTPSKRVFAPEKFWASPKVKPMISAAGAAKACRTNGKTPNLRYARKALGLRSSTNACGPVFRKRFAAEQRRQGYRGKAADGIPGRKSLTVVCKRVGCKVSA